MRYGGLAILFMAFGAATPAASATPDSATPDLPAPPRGVVELFTSQGCSSCPPADKLLGDLAKSPDLIALSFPVDYWDYIGWKDTLADPAFTARQKAYAAQRGDGQVYTPQAVVDGIAHVVGSDRMEISGALTSSAQRKGALTVPVRLAVANGQVAIDVGAAPADGPRKAAVWLLDTIHSKTVAVGKGENSGRSLTYTNVVRKISKLGDWTGEAAHFELASRLNDGGYVVLLQSADPGPGAILGAAKSP